MKNIHLILVLIAALWSVSHAGSSPFLSVFAQSGVDDPGGVVACADPETDPSVIFMPPPR